ncbi:MAG: arginine N-succinyltransferase [Verrucomicrobia bacterium]|nr:arginine N-succinyltransferase [Verrucomicrobiota bacterium]
MFPDFVLRPIEESDLFSLKRLAESIKGGMTSLPPEAGALEERIHQSQRSFDHRIKTAGGDHYLFVLEDRQTLEVVGTAGIIARVGGFDPFYTYEIRMERFLHSPLEIDKEMEVLHLKLDHKGPSEVCSLCLRPEYRKAGLGQLLSLSRFLFMCAFPQRFDERVIAELRGFTDDAGLSPFWEALGRHFFHQSFAEADFLSGIGHKDFIRDLIPRYPIYKAMLPTGAQTAIGRVHRDAEPALRILLKQGFQLSNEVDIFDAGPLVRAKRSDIHAIKNAGTANLSAVRPLQNADPCIIAHVSLSFTACLGALEISDDGTLAVTAATAARLQVEPGNRLIYLPLSKCVRCTR